MSTTPTKALIPSELHGLRPAGTYTFDELYRLAQVCHASGMFKDTADAAQAMMKIVRGQELGLPPTTAMSAFDIIKDRLFIKPWVIAAKINACGYGTYEVTAQSPESCTIGFMKKYPGRGWVALPPVTYTLAEAKAHGLVERSPHWKASPANMLYQRAMGRGGAMYFPELLAGLEMPPDDTPVSRAQREQHVIELFGDDPRGSTPTRPAGGAADYVPQIEALLLAQGVDPTTFWPWAERQLKKVHRIFTPQDYAALLAKVQQQSPMQRDQTDADARLDPTTGEVFDLDASAALDRELVEEESAP
jgi:hypothetical protein